MIKQINWAPVLSFLIPGLGQIGLGKYNGFFWFIGYLITIYLSIHQDLYFIIVALIVWVFNIWDAQISSYINDKEVK